MAAALYNAPTPSVHGQDETMRKLQEILNRFEITIAEANDLVILQDYEIVIIADDSGSMRLPSAPSSQRSGGAPVKSRWDELKDTVGSIVEIATCFDQSGVDVYFLNRPPVHAVRSATDRSFVECFERGPSGGTPLTEALTTVASKTAGERPVLMFILTDGEPSGGKSRFISALRGAVRHGPDGSASRLKVQIMACTPEESEVEWLNDLDAELKEVDVTDDYFSERQEVLRAGRVTKFTRGDWCMKAMLGPVSQKFDAWDEGPRRRSKGIACNECVVQ